MDFDPRLNNWEKHHFTRARYGRVYEKASFDTQGEALDHMPSGRGEMIAYACFYGVEGRGRPHWHIGHENEKYKNLSERIAAYILQEGWL